MLSKNSRLQEKSARFKPNKQGLFRYIFVSQTLVSQNKSQTKVLKRSKIVETSTAVRIVVNTAVLSLVWFGLVVH